MLLLHYKARRLQDKALSGILRYLKGGVLKIRSLHVMALHCLVFHAMVAACLASPLVRAIKPEFFYGWFLPSYAAFAVLTVLGWAPPGGCILTQWEKRLMEREGKQPYQQSFLAHYVPIVTGLDIPKRPISIMLYVTMLIPVLVGLYGWVG
jgi:hypothetical protein